MVLIAVGGALHWKGDSGALGQMKLCEFRLYNPYGEAGYTPRVVVDIRRVAAVIETVPGKRVILRFGEDAPGIEVFADLDLVIKAWDDK